MAVVSALNIFKNAQESAQFAVTKSVPIVRTGRNQAVSQPCSSYLSPQKQPSQ